MNDNFEQVDGYIPDVRPEDDASMVAKFLTKDKGKPCNFKAMILAGGKRWRESADSYLAMLFGLIQSQQQEGEVRNCGIGFRLREGAQPVNLQYKVDDFVMYMIVVDPMHPMREIELTGKFSVDRFRAIQACWPLDHEDGEFRRFER